MFDHLIESKKKTDAKRFFGLGFVSVTMHTSLIAAAVYATLSAGEAQEDVAVDTMMVLFQEEQQKEEEQQPVVQLDVPLKGFQTVVAPTEIPTDIPPINLQEQFDPKDYTGTGVEGGVAGGLVPSSDQVYSEAVVEERPERLSSPPVQYPELLRQAGIQGRVLVEAVIDTLGRAEPRSVKVVQSPNPGFNQSAITVVQRSLFRPARVHGRAVRVLIRQPIDFNLQGTR
ncbi:MAG: energy transducer TonB [Gemmatimonadales bacterium]